MKIKTDTSMVKKAREGVMEFLLANHPLDCPICDQGGECDLQDQSMKYGSDRGRFHEIKRTVEDKNLGPFVKTIMTRCIHCTRCVRYTTEIAGIHDLGVTGRGNGMEIGTYVDKKLDSEVSGNVIDVCPVGALTSKPYAFVARPWELNHVDSIDCFDGIGANTRLDCRHNDLLRILPRLNEDVNEEWIADKSRFAFDGLRRQRLDAPMIKKDGKLIESNWEDALDLVAQKLNSASGKDIRGLAGPFMDAESLIAFKDLLNSLGCDNVQCSDNTSGIRADFRSQYIMGSRIVGVETADSMLIIGANTRMEGALLNARIRKSVVQYGLNVGYIGLPFKSTFDLQHLGNDLKALKSFLEGSAKGSFWQQFSESQKPMVLIGETVLRTSESSDFIYSALAKLCQKIPLVQEDWNGVNFLQTTAARTAGLDLGLIPGAHAASGPGKVYFLLGADDYSDSYIPNDAFVIYLGSHGDKGASRADVILPGVTFTEKMGTYVNTEGRVQEAAKAVTPPGDAREDWAVLRALSEVIGKPLPYDSLDDVRARLVNVAPHFATAWDIESPSIFNLGLTNETISISDAAASIKPFLDNYFITDPITRCSKSMAKASKELPNATNSYIRS
jgi:NADH dehydrogenase (ubiquinone) Fe-S protein 1